MRKKYIIVTGWVISGIWKGVTTAATGFFLSEKYNITPIKLDWYLNIDPGTMNPHEHGEVFVLSDGAEVDMDFGHYERFLGNECSGVQSISMGKIYAWILEKERRGWFLGKTVQMIPHVTDHINERIEEVFSQRDWDICMIEVWWTVWDIEVELYLEAVRQMKRKKRPEDFLHIHLTYVPIPGWVDEQKTKPTQQSISLLQSKGLFPDIIMVRGAEKLTKSSREKIALFGNLREDRVFSLPDVDSIYSIPQVLQKQKFDKLVFGKLWIPSYQNKKLLLWENTLNIPQERTLHIWLIWKYTALEDSYSSVVEALKHVWHILSVKIEISFINTRKKDGIAWVKKCDGCIVPGGFGDTAVENMITTLEYIRENNIPCLWICLWLQLMTIEYMRNILNTPLANSLEFDKNCSPNDVITLLDSQKDIVNLGGTMRLGKQTSKLKTWKIKELYKDSWRLEWTKVEERFRHRYEVHPEFAKKLQNSDLHVSGTSPAGIVQFIEMNNSIHPYYVATQSHPELTSRLEDPSPLFVGLIQVCLQAKK
jgi:CTP synthase